MEAPLMRPMSLKKDASMTPPHAGVASPVRYLNGVGGWVDGWMGRWVDGWMGGWVVGWHRNTHGGGLVSQPDVGSLCPGRECDKARPRAA